MSNDKDFKVKNGIQPTVYHEGLGTVVSGSEGYSISGASYDSVSFSVASQDTSPNGMTFNADGTKLFIIGRGSDSVYQYTLSTAFDLSTASYSSVSFSVASQDANPFDITLNNDGTKMYMVGRTSDSVYQYSLSTAFDLSTASYNSVSFSVASQETNPSNIAFNNDGTKMYIMGVTADAVFQYSLSTAFDLSTASYDSVSFSITQDTAPEGMTFNADGTKLFMVGSTGNSVYQYSLSTAFNVSTMSYDIVSFSVASQDNDPSDIAFNNNGTKMYIMGRTGTSIYQYSTALNTAELDLSTGSVFEVTPTSDIQVTLSNPADSGTVSGATLLLNGEAVDTASVGEVFSTSLYDGTSSAQTITNGIDLAGDGGMVWGKIRSAVDHHWIVDSENGIGSNGTYNYLEPSLTTALRNFGDRSVKTFNSDGFTLANSTNDQFNLSPETYVSWTFRKDPKFFDVQTFTTTYNLNPNVISHNLGGEVGCAIFKQTAATSQGINWIVYHKSLGTGKYLKLNDTASVITDSQSFTAVDTNTISFGYPMGVTADRLVSGGNETTNWVGYFFANDTASDSRIKCGSYTGTGGSGVSVNLGWQPQWVMVKRATGGTADWHIWDDKRGITTGGNDSILFPNSSASENTTLNRLDLSSTGFEIPSGNNITVDGSGDTYIYIAIRGTYTPTITYDPTLEWPGGTAPTAPAIGETDVVTFNTRDGGSTYQGVLAIDGAK